MIRHWILLLCLAFASAAFAQTITRQNLAGMLGFENGSPGAFPNGWIPTQSPIYTDNQVVHGGKYSARIERSSSSGDFSTITATIPLDFAGKTIEWRGFLQYRCGPTRRKFLSGASILG